MGYATRYELTIKENKSGLTNDDIILKTIVKLTELDVINYALDENLETYDSVKWYEHDEHMKKVSSEILNVVYLLEGAGEESADVWKKYYLNGKMQRCKAKLVFDEFDENKLK